MRLAPELHALRSVKWDAFCTLTFAGSVPRPARRIKVLFAWLRRVSRLAQVPFSNLLWVSRDEAGETFGRHHFHVIIAGLRQCSTDFMFLIKGTWPCGFADVRGWSGGLGALGYLGIDGADFYESSKFGTASGLIVSESLRVMVRTGDNVDTGRVEQARKEGGLAHTPDNAGKGRSAPDDQQQPSVRGLGSERPQVDYLVAANASDQGIVLCRLSHIWA